MRAISAGGARSIRPDIKLNCRARQRAAGVQCDQAVIIMLLLLLASPVRPLPNDLITFWLTHCTFRRGAFCMQHHLWLPAAASGLINKETRAPQQLPRHRRLKRHHQHWHRHWRWRLRRRWRQRGPHCNYIRVINCRDNRFDIRDKNTRLLYKNLHTHDTMHLSKLKWN